jgi:predicted phosphodiesterase
MTKMGVAKFVPVLLVLFSWEAWAGFVRGPYSVALGPGEVVICWQADSPKTATVLYEQARGLSYYGKGPSLGTDALWESTTTPTLLGQVRLVDLLPGVEYVYQVVLADGEKSDLGRTVTPPADATAFSFLVYGDTRTHYDRHALVTARMAEEEAAFVVHTGDLVEFPTTEEWDSFFLSGEKLFLRMPFYPVLGNHERNHRSYYDLFVLPPGGGRENEQWWAIFWGDVLLVGLDSNTPYLKLTGLQAETAWLEGVLSQEARYKFVFLHHPLWSSDVNYQGDEGLAALWHPLFLRYGVTAVFMGHAHNYEHIVRDGVDYIVTGGGGAPLSPLSPERVEGSVFGVDFVLHYVRVQVGEDEVTVEMVPVAEVRDTEVTSPASPMERFVIVAEQARSLF